MRKILFYVGLVIIVTMSKSAALPLNFSNYEFDNILTENYNLTDLDELNEELKKNIDWSSLNWSSSYTFPPPSYYQETFKHLQEEMKPGFVSAESDSFGENGDQETSGRSEHIFYRAGSHIHGNGHIYGGGAGVGVIVVFYRKSKRKSLCQRREATDEFNDASPIINYQEIYPKQAEVRQCWLILMITFQQHSIHSKCITNPPQLRFPNCHRIQIKSRKNVFKFHSTK